MPSLESLKISYIDCQSTGWNTNADELLELAYDDDAYLIAPTKPLSKKIQSLTGITSKHMSKAISRTELFDSLKVHLQKTTPDWIVAHFARYEIKLLNDLWHKQGGETFPIPFICTHQLAKRLRPDLPAFGLRTVASCYGDPLQEHKRAQAHVNATKVIWRKMLKELLARGINDTASLAAFLAEKPAKMKVSQKSYPIHRDIRLSLPDQPGVYRYIAKDGRILYIGKASSLKHRVNSYFTGGLKRDHRKREMLSQAVDVKITILPTPLHAGMLEFEEIQKHQPPYNKMLRGVAFSLELELQMLLKDPDSLDENDLMRAEQYLFPGIGDLCVLCEGLRQWRGLYPSSTIWSYRNLVRFGLPLLKEWIATETERRCVAADATQATVESELEEVLAEKAEVFIWTKELIAEAATSWTCEAAKDHLRRRYLTRLRGAILRQDDTNVIFETSKQMVSRQAKVLLHEMRRASVSGHPWQILKPWPMQIPFWA